MSVASGCETKFGTGKFYFDCMKKHGDKIFIIEDATGTKLTYNDHLKFSSRIALRFLDNGVTQNDIIAVCSLNNLDVTLIPYATVYVGAILAAISPNYTGPQKEGFVKSTKPKYIFTDQASAEFFQDVIDKNQLDSKLYVFGTEAFETLKEPHSKEDTFEPVLLENADKAIICIVVTSGTTSNLKAVNMMHGSSINFALQYLDTEKYLDITLINYEYTFGGGLFLVGLVTIVGGTVVLLSDLSFDNAAKAIDKYKVTHMRSVPRNILGIARSPMAETCSYDSVKYICIYGQPIYRAQMLECQSKYKNAFIINTYGCLEAPTIFKFDICDGRDFILQKGDSVGRLWRKDIEIRLIDLDTGKPVGKNQLGEIWVGGKNLFNGYYKDPEATAKVLDKEGFFHTGDLGCFDDDDCMYILGRKEMVLTCQGRKVSPVEIERVIVDHPAVATCAIVGIQENGNDLPMAVVVKRPNMDVTEEELVKFVNDRLPEEKHIRRGVKFVDELPRTAFGKIHLAKLRELYSK